MSVLNDDDDGSHAGREVDPVETTGCFLLHTKFMLNGVKLAQITGPPTRSIIIFDFGI